MTTDYREVMSGHSNETLVKILTVKRDQYQPEALEAAQQELEKRGLKLSDFAMPSEKPLYSEATFAGQYNINGTSRNAQTQPDLQSAYDEARKKQANKDMLYGALWCIGGIIATASSIGAIFWGAIIFGGIQFFKGLINSQSN
jgi:hypothetical protein